VVLTEFCLDFCSEHGAEGTHSDDRDILYGHSITPDKS
jgi:hypothetical protein